MAHAGVMLIQDLLLFAGSYYLTTTYGALEHIKNYDKITVTRQLSMEVQDSIHRWERRRTLNKARASRSSVQVAGVTSRGKGPGDECALSVLNHFKYGNYLKIKSTQITIKRVHTVQDFQILNKQTSFELHITYRMRIEVLKYSQLNHFKYGCKVISLLILKECLWGSSYVENCNGEGQLLQGP